MKDNKIKFYIHIGPAKTGSSVIQYWLNNNIESLKKHGIFYPKHLNEAPINNGNALAILDKKNGVYEISQDKIDEIYEQASIESCSSILISSESFYPIIYQLLSKMPDACYIAYIRDPISSKLSEYNQKIKRKGLEAVFKLKKNLFNQLIILNNINSCHDIRLRSYFFDYDKQWNISNDLLRTIGSNLKNEDPALEMNNSYAFDALEFKRRANSFLDIKHQQKLDSILQNYNPQHNKYSLITIEEQENIKKLSLDVLIEQTSISNHSHNLHKLVAMLEKKENLPFMDQSNQDLCFDDVYEFIASKDINLASKLKNRII